MLLVCQELKLRGPTNYLLPLTAFFEILHQSAHFVFLFVAASGINFINYSTALQFELHTIFGATAAQTALASTGVDRLLSVLIPLKYNKINIRLYLSIHTILVFSSGIWMSINAILFANKYPTLPVTGHIGDLFILDMEIMFKFIMNWLVNVFGGFLSNIGASAETPILYIFSSIYREAINKQLKRFSCKKFQKNKFRQFLVLLTVVE
uniref:Uncharacterized protein n=1 Tax=Meloidogyne enterolobii TaxID=390850 RepID=A0A6V7Y381_MELEN|nr:unnamed protein product [Meloidogyne enterolobii]